LDGALKKGRLEVRDNQIRQEILEVFQWDPRIELERIEVAVKNCVVTLTEAVGTDDERMAMEEAIRHVAGVRQILQKIEVRHAPGNDSWRGRSDCDLATD
jgi:osmotically-inducible protein OsmY